jgi:hypothetical protein
VLRPSFAKFAYSQSRSADETGISCALTVRCGGGLFLVPDSLITNPFEDVDPPMLISAIEPQPMEASRGGLRSSAVAAAVGWLNYMRRLQATDKPLPKCPAPAKSDKNGRAEWIREEGIRGWPDMMGWWAGSSR